MTFKERFLRGECCLGVADDWIQLWHEGVPSSQPLHEFLGLSDVEYQAWLREGQAGLARAISKDIQVVYKAVHLDWDELSDQLQSLVQDILGPGCNVSIKRLDYYYWEMIISFMSEIDEEQSAEICELLKLQGVEPDRFVDNDDVDNDQMLWLLEKLTGYEVSSSHADDDGVWFICKEHRVSSQEFADRLLADCEKRLRNEIKSKHYSLVNRETACHQLFGFKEALKALDIIPEEQCVVKPDHFSDVESNKGIGAKQPSSTVNLPSAYAIQKAKQCLADNGIEDDETETVLEALGYILFDADIIQGLEDTSIMTELCNAAFEGEQCSGISESRCKEQQQFIDEIAASIGCVAIRPDSRSDCAGVHMVQLYLPDGIRQGRPVIQKSTQSGKGKKGSPKHGKKQTDLFQSCFWSFQNTNQLGRFDCESANHGQLDLSGDNWRTVIEGSIKLAYYERVQSLYAIGGGGYALLREADDTYNDLNRRMIDAFYKANGTAFLGKINLSKEKLERITAGTDHVLEEYTGQFIYNFGCEYVVPTADKTLEQLILDWNRVDPSHDQPSAEKIMETVERLGGRYFLWY